MSLLTRVRDLLRRRRLDLDERDFRDEIRAHLAIATDERMADGADRRAARQAALKDFGNVTLTTEAARHVWTPRWLDALRDVLSDVRYAVRALTRNPVFSLTVVGVLALGIGLNATVFTMLKGLALNPVAGARNAAGLSVVYAETDAGRQLRVSYPDYQYLRDHNTVVADLMGTALFTAGLGRGPRSRPIWGELVSGNYFRVLDVGAELGRTILPSDEVAPGRPPIIVISDGLWRRDFGADPHILGRTVEINAFPLTVVGVADPAFHGTTVVYDVEVFVPVMMAPQLGVTFGSRDPNVSTMLFDRNAAVFFPQGFLRPGATRASAADEINALWATVERDRPITEPAQHPRVVPFWRMPYGAPIYMLPSLVVLSAMGLLVLTIACANIAGLVLVRGLSRRGEIALRLALGAPRRRIVRLLVVENLILAVPGAVLGVILASRGLPILVHYAEALAAPSRVFFNLAVDRLVMSFAIVVACGSALVFGFVPALRSSRVGLSSAMSETSPRGAARGRLRAGLVVAQVAVSLLLLVGSNLVSRSFDAARHTDPGYSAAQVTSVEVDLRQHGYDETHGRVFYRRLLDAARDDPATESATLAAYVPLMLIDTPLAPAAVEGYTPQRGEDLAFLYNVVAPDYFHTLRVPLLAGREFAVDDDQGAAPVAIVNRTLAGRFWGGAAQAIGRRIRVRDGDWRTVVGVAADVKYLRINESPRPYVYLPFLQAYRTGMILHTRGPAVSPDGSRTSVDALVDRARAEVSALDPDLPILAARPLADHMKGALMFFNLTASMLFVFGAAGMVLAALGTYGLVSYAVKQSTHEIGIRMALGASALGVVRTFIGRGARLGVLGVALGLVAAFGLGQLLRSALYGVSPTDAASFVEALALVLACVLVSTLVPAWRASRTDALTALRHE